MAENLIINPATGQKYSLRNTQERATARTCLAKHGIDFFGDQEPAADDRSGKLKTRANARRALNAIHDATQKAFEVRDEAAMAEYTVTTSALSNLVNEISSDLDLADAVMAERAGRGAGTPGVLASTERFADLKDGGERYAFGFGEFVKSMVAGTGNPDIRAALSEGTDSAGGYTVPTTLLRELIDRMRAKTVCVQAGARTVPLDTQVTKIARLASDPAAAWRNENAAIAESDPTFEAISFTARSLAVMVKVGREVLEDSVNINDALLQAFAGAMAVELDRVALFGSGSAPEPRGIFNTTNVGSVSMGADGAQLTSWDKAIDSLYEIEVDNAAAPTAMVMHPRTRNTIAKLKDSTNQPLAIPPALAAIPQLVTTTVPITQAQGTSGNVCSSIIVGDFTQLYVGVRQQLRIEVLRERYAENHQYAFVAHLRADVALAQPSAFCKLIGILP